MKMKTLDFNCLHWFPEQTVNKLNPNNVQHHVCGNIPWLAVLAGTF